MSSKEIHFVVVGGGIAGLSCADAIAEHLGGLSLKKGVKVKLTIVEAAERVGGRTMTVKSDMGANVDLGGQWFGRTQTAALGLVKKLGLTLIPQYVKGRRIFDYEGILRYSNSDIPDCFGIMTLLDLQQCLWRMEHLRLQISKSDPAQSASAIDLAATSMADLINRYCWTSRVKAIITTAIQAISGQEPEDISALYFLHYANCADGFEALVSSEDGFQEFVLAEGTQSLSEHLQARVQAVTSADVTVEVCLRSWVRKISYDGRGQVALVVQSGVDWERAMHLSAAEVPGEPATFDSDEFSFVEAEMSVLQADHVVLAVPPFIAGQRIAFSPPLPDSHLAAMLNNRVGGMIKIITTYERAFWREAKYSGEVAIEVHPERLRKLRVGTMGLATDDPARHGPIFNIFEGSRPYSRTVTKEDGTTVAETGHVPVLVSFINAGAAQEWGGDENKTRRRAAALKQLERYFGKEASNPLEYIEKDWTADPYTRGCPVGAFDVGSGSTHLFRDLRFPCYDNRLSFATTELATRSQGFIDGAVRAGQRAAVLVLSHNWHRLFDAGIDQLKSPTRWTPPSAHAFPGLRAAAWRLRNKAFHRPQQALLCLLIGLWILYRLLC